MGDPARPPCSPANDSYGVTNSVDLLFDNQPLEGDLKEYEAILAHLRDSEREIVSGAAGRSPCGASMKAILIRNKDLLARVLKVLPVVGDG